jgi:hypothetical protein
MMTKRAAGDLEHEVIFDGFEIFPSINVAQTVDKLIEERGIQEAACHAAGIARAAHVMQNEDAAADWDEVYRLVIARRGM